MVGRVKLFVFAVIGGIAITLLTGVIQNTPAMLVGAVWYGYPLAWLIRRIVSPQYFPWALETPRLIADIIFWTTIIAVVVSVYKKLCKK
jgi:hypothetical protein